MGRDKSALEIDGQSFLEGAARLLTPFSLRVEIVGGSEPSNFGPTSIERIPDMFPGLGPLGGIATALAHSSADWNLIVACDMPYLTPEWLQFLIARAAESNAEIVMAESERGLEPLCAMYRKRIEPRIAEALRAGVRKVTDGLAGCRMEILPRDTWESFDPDGRLFKNVNTPEDYAEAQRLLGRGAKS